MYVHFHLIFMFNYIWKVRRGNQAILNSYAYCCQNFSFFQTGLKKPSLGQHCFIKSIQAESAVSIYDTCSI